MAMRRQQDPVLLPPGGPGGGGSPGNPNPSDGECCLDGGCSSSTRLEFPFKLCRVVISGYKSCQYSPELYGIITLAILAYDTTGVNRQEILISDGYFLPDTECYKRGDPIKTICDAFFPDKTSGYIIAKSNVESEEMLIEAYRGELIGFNPGSHGSDVFIGSQTIEFNEARYFTEGYSHTYTDHACDSY